MEEKEEDDTSSLYDADEVILGTPQQPTDTKKVEPLSKEKVINYLQDICICFYFYIFFLTTVHANYNNTVYDFFL